MLMRPSTSTSSLAQSRMRAGCNQLKPRHPHELSQVHVARSVCSFSPLPRVPTLVAVDLLTPLQKVDLLPVSWNTKPLDSNQKSSQSLKLRGPTARPTMAMARSDMPGCPGQRNRKPLLSSHEPSPESSVRPCKPGVP